MIDHAEEILYSFVHAYPLIEFTANSENTLFFFYTKSFTQARILIQFQFINIKYRDNFHDFDTADYILQLFLLIVKHLILIKCVNRRKYVNQYIYTCYFLSFYITFTILNPCIIKE